jgi:hypothetical protein
MKAVDLRTSKLTRPPVRLNCKGGPEPGVWVKWHGMHYLNNPRTVDLFLNPEQAASLHALLGGYLQDLETFKAEADKRKAEALEAELKSLEKRHEEVLEALNGLGWLRPEGSDVRPAGLVGDTGS